MKEGEEEQAEESSLRGSNLCPELINAYCNKARRDLQFCVDLIDLRTNYSHYSIPELPWKFQLLHVFWTPRVFVNAKPSNHFY